MTVVYAVLKVGCARNYKFVLRRAYRVLRERRPFGCAQGKLTGDG